MEQGTAKILEAGETEKYTDIREVIEDCINRKNFYLRGHLTASDVILQSTVSAVLWMIERGQLSKAVTI